MKTNNHPAQGPVSLDRLHQISEILSKAAAQSDGGNLGYAMSDAVKVIDSAIAAFGAEPVAWVSDNYAQNKGLMFGEKEKGAGPTFIAKYWDLEMFDGNQDWLSDAIENTKAKPLYTAPPAPVVPEQKSYMDFLEQYPDMTVQDAIERSCGWNACRAAMLQANYRDLSQPVDPQVAEYEEMMNQAGNSPVSPDGSEKFANSVERFGKFSAELVDGGEIGLSITLFHFGNGSIPEDKLKNTTPKFMLQGVINELQKKCDAMSDESLINLTKLWFGDESGR